MALVFDGTANSLRDRVTDLEGEVFGPNGSAYRLHQKLTGVENIDAATVLSPGGGTARTLAEWMGDVVRPEAFGAVGDGVTDDAAAIQAALNYAGTTREVVLSGKTYAIGASLTVDSRMIRGVRPWRPVQGGTILKVIGAVTQAIKTTNDAAVVRDLAVDANGLATYGVFYDTATDVNARLEGVAVSTAVSAGFYLKKMSVGAALNLYASGTSAGPGFLFEDCNALNVHNLRSRSNTGNGVTILGGVTTGYSGGLTLTGRINIESNTAHGLYVSGTRTPVEVHGLWAESNGGDGVRAEDARFVQLYGGRLSGVGDGSNRAVRFMAGSHGGRVFGTAAAYTSGNVNWGAVEIESGAYDVEVFGATYMDQVMGNVVAVPVNRVDRARDGARVEAHGSAAPVAGLWKRGDRVWNTAASSGQPMGWMCAADGSPGTWVAMPNL